MDVSAKSPDFDAVIIGAGFSGLGMLHRLRNELGMSVQVYEAGDGVGGTWYWNRYPGARCDSLSYLYCYSFSKELLQDWNWTGKYPEQPEILSYFEHVADRFDLRRDIKLNTRVTSARFLEDANAWQVETDRGDLVTARSLITAVGCLSTANVPEFKGLDSFAGERYHTGAWPHEGVDFAGKSVAVIGTGSSGVQAIPVIAQQAGSVTVFQRTAQYTVPARHHTVDPKFLNEVVKPNYDKILEDARWAIGGSPIDSPERSALEATAEERREVYEAGWDEGGGNFVFVFNDIYTDRRSNDTISEFIRSKIREIVKDPDTAETLLPVDHPFGSKRALIDTDYFEAYNRDNVKLVDIRHSPIQEITPKGIRTEDEEYEFDVIVFATGFDAMTGSYFKIDIRGKNGVPLKDKWAEGPKTYLGVQVAGFPNMFMITGPGSPSVLSNMATSIEQHIEWISNLLDYMREHEIQIPPRRTPTSETAWVSHVNEVADETIYPLANSWYLGANIPGKPRVFTPYAGGVGTYRQKCIDVADAGYEGFIFGRPDDKKPPSRGIASGQACWNLPQPGRPVRR